MAISESRTGGLAFRRGWRILLVLAAITATCDAGSTPQLEARSADGGFVVQIQPGKGKSRRCEATMRQADRKEAVWKGTLANLRAPMQLHVADGGRYLVTLDEVRWGGARNAVVAYDVSGKMLRKWSLRELMRREDWQHVAVRKPTVEWLDGAKAAFSGPDEFQIRLRWGRTLRFDLKSGTCPDAPAMGEHNDLIPPEIAAILAVAERPARGDGPDGETRIDIAQVEDAATTLADEANPPLALHWSLLKAMISAELTAAAELAAQAGEAVFDAQAGEESQAAAGDQGADVTASRGADADRMPTREPSAWHPTATGEVVFVTGDAAVATGILTPMPDPANPVDYLAWMNEQTRVEDPAAQRELQSIMQKAVKFEGDGELLRRALQGEPDALKDPVIQQWRAANAEAIQHLRDFTLYPYRGPELHSEDGSLIGVLLPALGKMRDAGRAAVVEANSLVLEQRYKEAADLLADTLRAGAKTGQGPTLIENLVGTAIQSMASDALLELAANPEFAKSADLAQIAATLEMASEKPRSLAENMQFERAMVLDLIQRSFAYDAQEQTYRPQVNAMLTQLGGVAGEQPNPLVVLQMATLDFRSTLAETNSAYDRLTEHMAQPYTRARALMNEWEQGFDENQQNPLLRVMLPAVSRASLVRGRNDAKQHASVLVQNLLAYQQQHGAPPDSLVDFAGREFVIDPLTGEQFRYERTADGFRLYSVGLNGTDDGGLHDDTGETNDIVFWPRPQRQPR